MNTIIPDQRSASDSRFPGGGRAQSTNSGREFRSRDPADRTHDLAASKDQLIADFKSLVADGEELLRSTANLSGDAAVAARSKFEKQWAQAKIKLDDAQTYAMEHGRQAAAITDHYVHDHPWTAVGVAGGIGLLAGLLLSRRF